MGKGYKVSYMYNSMLEVMLFEKNNVDFKSMQHSWHPRLYFELEN